MEPVMNLEGVKSKKRTKAIYGFIKRCFEVVSAAIAIVVLMPVFLLVAIIVKFDSRGNVIFVHERLGENSKKIKVYKFRTMVPDAEQMLKNMPDEMKIKFEENYKLEDDPRITKVGKFLRESSLDELPQLFNILKGDMSVVGPRPIVEKELEKYGEFGDKLLTVKPGLTGYWQVNGRSNTSYEDRVKLDMDYIDTRTFLVDMVIIFKTVKVVIQRIGAR